MLGIGHAHVSKIENGNGTPSELLLRHIESTFLVSKTWLSTGDGEMFIPLAEIIKRQIKQFGEREYYEAIRSIADARALAILIPRTGGKTVDPDLHRMLTFLVDLWALGDEDMKIWAKVQFARAFPPDIEDEVQKKWAEKQGQVSS